MAAPTGRYSVFIAHSSVDAWTASRLDREIRSLGAHTFLSEISVEGGDDFGDDIRRALNGADECVVLYTPEAGASKYVWVEVGGAWTAGKRVVLLLCRLSKKDVTTDPTFPAYLKSLDFLDLNCDTDTRYLPQLRARIEARAGGDG